jgi:hypothetical protein
MVGWFFGLRKGGVIAHLSCCVKIVLGKGKLIIMKLITNSQIPLWLRYAGH